MRQRAAVLALLVAASVVSQAQQPAFRAGASAVAVDVSVRDRSGRPVTGLQIADFEVLDNGVVQEIVQLSYGKLPIDITIALDVSYSVTGSLLAQLRRAVGQLMRDLGRDDRLKLVLFNMKVTRTIDFTREAARVDEAIRTAVAGGGTAFFDAVSVALVSASSPDRSQLILFFTDGTDSVSTTTPDVLVKVAGRTRATLTFVTPGVTSMLPTVQPSNARAGTMSFPVTIVSPVSVGRQEVPAALARETGGSVLPVGPNTDLGSTFRQVLDRFRSTYVLYYNARGVEAGGFHTLDVTVSRNNVVVTARRGYQAFF